MDNRAYLESLGIHELRIKGRSVGVKSPASKKKEELIDDILSIEEGRVSAHKTNRGRPPKGFNRVYDNEELNDRNNTLIPDLRYDLNMDEQNDGLEFNSDLVLGINPPLNFTGIVGEYDGKFIVTDYYDDSLSMYIPSKYEKKLKDGDIVEGSAYLDETGKYNVGLIEIVEFEDEDESFYGLDKCKYMCVKDKNSMYDYIIKENCKNKIVFEVETDTYSSRLIGRSNTYAFCTHECEDIAKSHNLIADCESVIKNLIARDESFTLYLVDIQFMFSIISSYYAVKYGSLNCDINAGQVLKRIFSLIANYEKARIVVLGKDFDRLSAYLSVILDKYCDNWYGI